MEEDPDESTNDPRLTINLELKSSILNIKLNSAEPEDRRIYVGPRRRKTI